MTACVLAGDVGGTKTNLAIYRIARIGPIMRIGRSEPARGAVPLELLREGAYPSREHRGLEEIVARFLAGGTERVAAAAFGIAGPVLGGRVKTTNLPWIVRAAALARVARCDEVKLLNDLEATAFGALFTSRRDLRTLNRGRRRDGNRAVIAAGTGLGQALLYWDGARHHPVATEGGHADFAPRNDRELALLVYLQKRFAHVSYERVLSGPGLVNVFQFLDEELERPVAEHVRERLRTEDPGAVIGEEGVAGRCGTCAEAVDAFVSLYGSQAGNLALTLMATGGVYVGGGIAAKLLPKLDDGTFLQAFVDKGRYRDLLADVPIHVLKNPKTALLGAGHAAAELCAARPAKTRRRPTPLAGRAPARSVSR